MTGLDNIDQRYYASSYGRFNTADQYQASAGPKDPGSWNRYSYTRGDPVNRVDPRGAEDYATGCDGDCDGYGSGGGGGYSSCVWDPEDCSPWGTGPESGPPGGGGGSSVKINPKVSVDMPGTAQQVAALKNGFNFALDRVGANPTCAGTLTDTNSNPSGTAQSDLENTTYSRTAGPRYRSADLGCYGRWDQYHRNFFYGWGERKRYG